MSNHVRVPPELTLYAPCTDPTTHPEQGWRQLIPFAPPHPWGLIHNMAVYCVSTWYVQTAAPNVCNHRSYVYATIVYEGHAVN